MRADFEGTDGPITVTLAPDGDGGWLATIGDGAPFRVRELAGPAGSVVLATDDGQVARAWAVGNAVAIGGSTYDIAEVSRRRDRRGGRGGGGLEAPMPGVVLQVRVAVGDEVEEGATLVVVEAMKMEHAIVAPRSGVVRAVCFVEGARVGPGDTLVELEEAP